MWLLLFFPFLISSYEVVFVKPVSDISGVPFTDEQPYEPTLASVFNPHNQRIHQALFNERAVVDEKMGKRGSSIYVRLSNAFLMHAGRRIPVGGWTHHENVMPLTAALSETVPPSLSFEDISKKHDSKIITLILPVTFRHDTTTLHFSVGTRFIGKSLGDAWKVTFYYPHAKRPVSMTISSRQAYVTSPAETLEQKREMMVSLVRRWIKSYTIPYVWGGSSLTDEIKESRQPIFASYANRQGVQAHAYAIPEWKERPYIGFDCSSLLLRVAQIFGVSYFCKNTTSVAQGLSKISDEQRIQVGDIIWHKGHVMMVSDVKNNKLIEAVGYARGGKVQEISLAQRFQGVSTYKHLQHMCSRGEKIQLVPIHGQMNGERKDVRLFKLVNYEN